MAFNISKHELVGWLLDTYFLESSELSLDYLFKPTKYDEAMLITKERKGSYTILPPPITVSSISPQALTALFGPHHNI